MIKVVGREKYTRELESRTSLRDLISELGLNENHFVMLVNGNPATSDEEVGKDDDVVFLEIFSGG